MKFSNSLFSFVFVALVITSTSRGGCNPGTTNPPDEINYDNNCSQSISLQIYRLMIKVKKDDFQNGKDDVNYVTAKYHPGNCGIMTEPENYFVKVKKSEINEWIYFEETIDAFYPIFKICPDAKLAFLLYDQDSCPLIDCSNFWKYENACPDQLYYKTKDSIYGKVIIDYSEFSTVGQTIDYDLGHAVVTFIRI